MSTIKIIILVSLLIGVTSSACGPSPAEQAATATQAAADSFATQTAMALTATPTPTPALSSVALTLDVLPAGFVEMPQVFFSDAMQSMPDGTYFFDFVDVTGFQMITGMLFPVSNRTEQATFDGMMLQMIEVFPSILSAEPVFQPLTGLDEIGESRAGITTVGPFMAESMRWDTVGFRRGEVVVILIVGYPDGDEPLMPMSDIAHLIDERIMNYLASESTGNTLMTSGSKTTQASIPFTVNESYLFESKGDSNEILGHRLYPQSFVNFHACNPGMRSNLEVFDLVGLFYGCR